MFEKKRKSSSLIPTLDKCSSRPVSVEEPPREGVVPPPRTATLNRPRTTPQPTDFSASTSNNALYEIPPTHSLRDAMATRESDPVVTHNSRDVIATLDSDPIATQDSSDFTARPLDDNDDLIAIAGNITSSHESRSNGTLLRDKPRNGTLSRDKSALPRDNSVTSRDNGISSRDVNTSERATSNCSSSSSDFRHTGTQLLLDSGEKQSDFQQTDSSEDIYENLLPLK